KGAEPLWEGLRTSAHPDSGAGHPIVAPTPDVGCLAVGSGVLRPLELARYKCYVRFMEFGILGPLAVWEDGAELELGAAKPRAVLAILLLHAGETMSTERLVD